MADLVIFIHPNGRDYVAADEHGEWWAWPAERDGWWRRQRRLEQHGDDCDELPPRLARLALLLSGAPSDA